MSEIVILSGQSSSLVASSYAGQGPDRSEYIYDMERSTVNRHKDRMVETPFPPGMNFGESRTVEIPSFGILNRMVLKTEFKLQLVDHNDHPLAPHFLDANGAAKERRITEFFKHNIYANLIDEVAIMNSSRRVLTVPGEMIAYLVNNLQGDARMKWEVAGGANPCFNADGMVPSSEDIGDSPEHSFVVYTPLFFSCFKEGGANTCFKSNFNTRFTEKLSCMVKYNDKSKAFIIPNNLAVSDFKSSLLCDFDVIMQSELNKIEEANYSLSQNLAMVMSDWTQVTQDVQGYNPGQTISVNLFNTQLVHSIVVVCEDKDAGLGESDKRHRLLPIRKLELSSAGRKIYKQTKDSNIYETFLLGSNDCYAGCQWAKHAPGYINSENYYVINFANDMKDTSKINGFCAFKNLNSCTLELVPGNTDAQVNLHNLQVRVYVRYYQAISISAQSGRLGISLSS